MPKKIEGVDEFSEDIFHPKKGEKTYDSTLLTTAQAFANRSIWSKARIEELTESIDGAISSSTVVYEAAGVPDDDFGNPLSLYIDSETNNWYYKATTSWELKLDMDNLGKLDSINDVTPIDKNIDFLVGDGLEIDSTEDGKITLSLYVIPVATLSGGSTVEIGATVSNPSLTWTYNKTEISQSLNQGLGSQSIGTRAKVDTVNVTTNRTYTITIDDGTNQITANTSIIFKNKSHWGTSALTSLSSPQILGLANEAFSTNRNLNFTIDGDGEYIYISYPASYGTATFTVNGLLNTAWTLSIVSHMNASGHVENYNVYRSNTVQNGTDISVEVS